MKRWTVWLLWISTAYAAVRVGFAVWPDPNLVLWVPIMIFTAFTVGCEKGHSGMMKSFEAQGFLLKKAWRAAGWDVSKLDYLNASDANKLGSGGDK